MQIYDKLIEEEFYSDSQIKEINQDLEDTNEIFSTFHDIVLKQEYKIQTINDNICTTEIVVQKGVKDIKIAEKISRKNIAIKLMLLGTFGGMAIGGPIGGVLGFKYSLGAVGCAFLGAPVGGAIGFGTGSIIRGIFK
jgi:hypothetical protein